MHAVFSCVLLLIAAVSAQPSNRSCDAMDVPLQSWHIHVLFPPSNRQATTKALALQNDFIDAFDLRHTPNCTMTAGDPAPHAQMCSFEIDWQAAGPFLTAQYSFFIPTHNLTTALAWMVRHRGSLDVMVHPNSGCEVEDHAHWSTWAGTPWELDTSIFTCEYPGCVPKF
eukprot:TRINITY_DN51835_c0_g1_i2.p1 TRINITY_DN51835_c0_g1~~TRINITY_DN51835_c0_g1_i2.p1  ORF type:complete len:169 (-),score=28.60 TRINITY_DN51835_c0_g1_i2:234-740(-)